MKLRIQAIAIPALMLPAVILLTSAGHSDTAIPGVDVEIVKPVRPSQLYDMLQTMLSARGPEAEAASGT